MQKPTKPEIIALIEDYAYKFHLNAGAPGCADTGPVRDAIYSVLDRLFYQQQAENTDGTKLPEARAKVFNAIGAERYYQEMKWGDLVDHPQSVGAYLTLMRVHLARAENAWAGANKDFQALDCLRKVLAIGVACGEQHGMPLRPNKAPSPGRTQEPQINLEGYREGGCSLAEDHFSLVGIQPLY